MLTQFFKSINWVDVALVVLLIRIVFISVVNGFVVELFKFLSIICALFVSFHYYSRIAAWAASMTSIFPLDVWRLLVFLLLLGGVVLALKFTRDGVLSLFKVEANHAGVDKYAGGLIGCARGVLLCSLTIFALLLVKNAYIHHQTQSSWGYKIAGKAAPNTYSVLFHKVVGKLFDHEEFNGDVFAVINSGHGTHSK